LLCGAFALWCVNVLCMALPGSIQRDDIPAWG
jgi:hypothetical protein